MDLLRVLIADDHPVFRNGMHALITSLPDMEVAGEATTGDEVVTLAANLQPDVILMDEPTSALDPISTLKVEELVQELKKDFSIIIVTHNMQQAARISDKTAFFLNGEVIEFAETDKIFSNPSDKRTEDYITGRFG